MPNLSYDNAWNEYRRRVRAFLGAWLGAFVFSTALMYALSLVDAAESLGMIIGAFWLPGFAIAGIRSQLFACPRCHDPFFSSHFPYWPFARKCMHCGLPKWH